ncbi:PTB domain-containing engulfment adapter protein 1 isoform X1 [Strongylocentrotus purpuratus]|uniref:PID domain-containing protein n=1 Tax=Strongylocentrotus purpuratus TaxID=7668 RepID=A0A7M7GJH7_STRPU|nr:PTB domain-containing engulfment adapter protein 1 isoform X1 [Strongylocentrotus purpuratus]XP_011674990.1 PTB domain-containing engulfment adapter protein 1 isoform X1 [Strongylocentrotus purpuratus]|eukprot:XP_003731338.1 PREDICTED: PTB domain-containing engulfment adapter protein 1 isoform X1 [Strongylocentrotus purpuratus]
MSAKWNNVKSGTKSWVHSAAALSAGHVVYNVKYLGLVEVSAPKGADIVKEAVTKLKFNKQVKRSEGTKPPKMELTISVDGVTIQDRQTKEKQFTYPLHHISYCADDKSDKKICAFIAKDAKENKNICHVMESDKNAEEITLTVGQAFDLAYQKFLSNANKTQEQQQQNETLRKRVNELEEENKTLKQKINEMEIKQGLNPSYTLQANGEQSFNGGSAKYNPFSQPSESNFGQFQSSSEPVTAINLLVDLKVSQPSSPSGVFVQSSNPTAKDTLAMQAAAYTSIRTNSTSSSSAFEDAFAPPLTLAPAPAGTPKTNEPFLPPPPAPLPRHIEASAPIFTQPAPVEPQSPISLVPPAQPSVDPAIARSRPRPQAVSQGPGVLAPPPRTMRVRGDSATSPLPTSPSPNVVGLDDLYAAVSKASKMNGSGVATTSPNPFAAPSTTEFRFGDDLDFLSNKGSSNVSTSNAGASSNSFSIMDLDPLK